MNLYGGIVNKNSLWCVLQLRTRLGRKQEKKFKYCVGFIEEWYLFDLWSDRVEILSERSSLMFLQSDRLDCLSELSEERYTPRTKHPSLYYSLYYFTYWYFIFVLMVLCVYIYIYICCKIKSMDSGHDFYMVGIIKFIHAMMIVQRIKQFYWIIIISDEIQNDITNNVHKISKREIYALPLVQRLIRFFGVRNI